VNDIKTLG